MMITIKKLPILCALLAFAGCASSPDSSQATSTVVDGIDVWKGGTPSRPYQVMDTVQEQGADSSSTFQDEENLIVRDAKNRGADGVIILNSVMTVSRMDLVNSRPIMAPKVQAELIKYQ